MTTEHATSPAGFRIANRDGNLIFNDPRIIEALEGVLEDGVVILDRTVDGKIRTRITHGPTLQGDTEALVEQDTGEYGFDHSLVRSLRHAMAYHFGGDDDFYGEIRDSANGRWSGYALNMHLSGGRPGWCHGQESDFKTVEDAITFHDLLHEREGVGHTHDHRRVEILDHAAAAAALDGIRGGDPTVLNDCIEALLDVLKEN